MIFTKSLNFRAIHTPKNIFRKSNNSEKMIKEKGISTIFFALATYIKVSLYLKVSTYIKMPYVKLQSVIFIFMGKKYFSAFRNNLKHNYLIIIYGYIVFSSSSLKK